MNSIGQTLHVHPHFNAEEAAHVAGEFLSTLDNLPGEVSFLLEEIREKDVRINNLLSRINQRHHGLTKHARTTISSKDGTTTPPFTLPLPPNTPLPTSHLPAKDAQALAKISTEFLKVQTLQEEKVQLAERMERIVSRARERGRVEWVKVGGMDLEEYDKTVGAGFNVSTPGRGGLSDMGDNEIVLPSTGLGPGLDRPMKKRKPNGLPILHPPPMAPPPAPRSGPGRRRVERQKSASTGTMDGDVDAEGEEEEEADAMQYVDFGEQDESDDAIYCTCRQKSYGEMIGCDNDDCEIEWYHVRCVDVSLPVPDRWYCPLCVEKLGFTSSDGRTKKGRKNR